MLGIDPLWGEEKVDKGVSDGRNVNLARARRMEDNRSEFRTFVKS